MRKAKELGITPEQLEEAVHEAAAAVAASINNGGLAEQVEYLVQHLGVVETDQLLAQSPDNARQE